MFQGIRKDLRSKQVQSKVVFTFMAHLLCFTSWCYDSSLGTWRDEIWPDNWTAVTQVCTLMIFNN